MHSSVEGYLSSFQLLAIMNKTAKSILEHLSLLHVGEFFGYMSRRNPDTHGYLIFDKEAKTIQWKKISISIFDAGSTGSCHVEECKFIYSYLFEQSLSPMWIKDLHISTKKMNLMEEKV